MNSIIVMIMVVIMLKALIILTKNMNSYKNFMNNLECGFNSMNNNKINFSMNFIYILIVFIMFDIELMIMVPLIKTTKTNMETMKMVNLFITFMLMTTLMEMKNNKINWML